MHGRRAVAATVGAALLFAGACAPRGAKKAEEEDQKRALTPTYAPTSNALATTDGLPTTGAVPSSATAATNGLPTSSSSTAPTVATAPVTVSLSDARGDITPSPIDRPPPWADLVGADLTLDTTGFTLRVHLAGGQAPTDIDGNHTMNIASFFDVNGDGQVDQEVWANLVYGGWGGSWFDDQKRTAKFGDDAQVTVSVDGDAVVVHFPFPHVNATSFRWSVASEWGSYAVIGTVAAARDDCPDNDQPAGFPG